jgi:hypothetical protein
MSMCPFAQGSGSGKEDAHQNGAEPSDSLRAALATAEQRRAETGYDS